MRKRWTHEEREQVLMEYVRLEGGSLGSTPGELLRRAQRVLPESRRKNNLVPSALPWWDAAKAKIETLEQPEVAPTPCTPEEYATLGVEAWIRAFRDLIARIERLESRLPAQSPLPFTSVGSPPPPPRLPRAGVLGLVGQQRQQLLERTQTLPLEVEVFERNRILVASSIDRCFLMTKFISHKERERAHAVFGRDRVIDVHGGMNALVATLIGFANEASQEQRVGSPSR